MHHFLDDIPWLNLHRVKVLCDITTLKTIFPPTLAPICAIESTPGISMKQFDAWCRSPVCGGLHLKGGA